MVNLFFSNLKKKNWTKCLGDSNSPFQKLFAFRIMKFPHFTIPILLH
jgi:hypothetical protein